MFRLDAREIVKPASRGIEDEVSLIMQVHISEGNDLERQHRSLLIVFT